jgi:hypothetical protein
MRIGSALIFLVVTWIGLGYLLADNINAYQTLGQLQQQLDEALNEKKRIQDQLIKANSENVSLTQQIAQANQEKLFLQDQVKQFLEESQILNKQNAVPENQLAQANNVNSPEFEEANVLPHSLMLAIFLPLLPISFLASLAIYQRHISYSSFKHRQTITSKRTLSVEVTEEEMQKIIKMRRG